MVDLWIIAYPFAAVLSLSFFFLKRCMCARLYERACGFLGCWFVIGFSIVCCCSFFFLFLMQMSFIAITAISFFSFLLLFVSAKRETRRSRCETVSERRRKREMEEVTRSDCCFVWCTNYISIILDMRIVLKTCTRT